MPTGPCSLIKLGEIAAAASMRAAAQTLSPSEVKPPAYAVKPLAFDPNRIKGLSEKNPRHHHDNNHALAVKRLSAITEQLAALVYEGASFVVNGLKREELHLHAGNSMSGYLDESHGSMKHRLVPVPLRQCSGVPGSILRISPE